MAIKTISSELGSQLFGACQESMKTGVWAPVVHLHTRWVWCPAYNFTLEGKAEMGFPEQAGSETSPISIELWVCFRNPALMNMIEEGFLTLGSPECACTRTLTHTVSRWKIESFLKKFLCNLMRTHIRLKVGE